MSFTNVFTGSTIYPSEISLTKLDLVANVVLYWPLEAPDGEPLASEIVEIDSTTGTWTIALPDATLVSIGQTILFNNRTASTVSILNSVGATLLAIPASTQWQLYLATNTTAAGVWRSYQFGAAASSANAGALAGLGLQASGSTLETTIPQSNISVDTTLTSSDRASLYNWEGAAGTITLPDALTVGNNWYMHLRNSGSGSISVVPVGINLINETSSLTFSPGDSATIVTDGTDFYTIGFGQNATFAFDYTVVNVGGAVDYTLTGTELNRIAYQFTGVLLADVTVIVPQTVQQYWVFNNTSGSFNLSIGTSTQASPLLIDSGTRTITYCDGSDVVPAVTSYIVGPISGGSF